MIYKILETTDGQHRGSQVEIIEADKVLNFPDGDSIKFLKLKPLGDDIFKVVSFNYVCVVQLVAGE